IHSLEFYKTDAARGFVCGARWGLQPTGGPRSQPRCARVAPGGRDQSITGGPAGQCARLRRKMFRETQPIAALCVGGMDGIEGEWKMISDLIKGESSSARSCGSGNLAHAPIVGGPLARPGQFAALACR